jgi:hypothetical protein
MKTLTDFFLNTILPSTGLMFLFCLMALCILIILPKIPYRIIFRSILGYFVRLEPENPEDEYAYLKTPMNKRSTEIK